LCVLEPLEVCDLARGLEHEREVLGNLTRPILQNRLFGHAIEGVVDLDRVQAFAVVGEHPVVGKVLRVKGALPGLVRKAARADPAFHRRNSP
jgi:hypothetical protein